MSVQAEGNVRRRHREAGNMDMAPSGRGYLTATKQNFEIK